MRPGGGGCNGGGRTCVTVKPDGQQSPGGRKWGAFIGCYHKRPQQVRAVDTEPQRQSSQGAQHRYACSAPASLRGGRDEVFGWPPPV
jgi:hypothetical protein